MIIFDNFLFFIFNLIYNIARYSTNQIQVDREIHEIDSKMSQISEEERKKKQAMNVCVFVLGMDKEDGTNCRKQKLLD